jgi:hypothetical protein
MRYFVAVRDKKQKLSVVEGVWMQLGDPKYSPSVYVEECLRNST